MISVSNLAKAYGDRILFASASCQLNPGERYGLVGANGSGKTTLLPILSGDLAPDDGKKRLSTLSGGESTRLVFTRLAIERPNVLVVDDEPTNHLDLESIEALVDGLKAFPGTLILTRSSC